MKRFRFFLTSLACRAHAFLFFYMTSAGLILCDVDPKMVKAALDQISVDIEGFKAGQKAKLGEAVTRIDELQARLLEVEQKGSRRGPGGNDQPAASPAAAIVDALMAAPGFEALSRGEAKSVAVMLPKASTIITTTPLGPQPQRDPAILMPLVQRLTIRDLLPVIPTTSGAVEYTKEDSFTNNADIQAAEGDIKGESGLTFSLVTAQVRTIAHFIPASRQILDDRSELMNYIETRLIYGLQFKEEQQLLLGSGVGVNLNGIYTQATAFSRHVGGDTKIDTIRRVITQLQLANATPTGIVLHPTDWEGIELTKDTTGQYIEIETTDSNGREVLWRLPVVPSNALSAGNYLVGDFARGAAIRDRQEARVEVSREHADFFTRNLVAILAEERLALTVFRPASFIKGHFGDS